MPYVYTGEPGIPESGFDDHGFLHKKSFMRKSWDKARGPLGKIAFIYSVFTLAAGGGWGGYQTFTEEKQKDTIGQTVEHGYTMWIGNTIKKTPDVLRIQGEGISKVTGLIWRGIEKGFNLKAQDNPEDQFTNNHEILELPDKSLKLDKP